jgi:hypothetical protein
LQAPLKKKIRGHSTIGALSSSRNSNNIEEEAKTNLDP